MARAERIFRYPKHEFIKTKNLAPRHMTKMECEKVLSYCVATNSTLTISTGKEYAIFSPEQFTRVQNLSADDQKKFLAYGSDLMKLGEKVSIKTPIHRFSKN